MKKLLKNEMFCRWLATIFITALLGGIGFSLEWIMLLNLAFEILMSIEFLRYENKEKH